MDVNTAAKDRRTGSRKNVSVRVYLGRGGNRRMRGVARDLSETGVYVEADPSELRPNTPVASVFVLEYGRVVRLVRLAARVVRICRQGVALEFIATRRLQAYMRGRRTDLL